MAKEGMLLESGTNEVEPLEFLLDGQSFGVNVLKVQAIEQFDPERVTRIQLPDPAVIGTLLFRDNCITLIDLARQLRGEVPAAASDAAPASADDLPELVKASADAANGEVRTGAESPDNKLVLIMEFNEMKTAFLVDGVNRIHRVPWGDISPMSPFLDQVDSKFTGSIQIDGREVLIVDMEKIVAEILPGELALQAASGDSSHPNYTARGELTVFLAEDSAVIRDRVEQELLQANYTRVVTFANGQECYDRIVEIQQKAAESGEELTDHLSAVVTDIEMPAMDGLALCHNVKSGLLVKEVPFIIFSSLINEQIAQKCNEVGADVYISKPQFAQLVDLLDRYCLGTVNPRP